MAEPYRGGRKHRLSDHDYRTSNRYFVTICTANRELILGEIDGGIVHLSEAGDAVLEAWQTLENRFETVATDDYFCIMPNHIHGILSLHAATRDVSCPTLGTVIRAFKSMSAIAGNRALGRSGEPFWQRNYHDRIIRNNRDLDRIRSYIAQNPYNWNEDEDNPEFISGSSRQ